MCFEIVLEMKIVSTVWEAGFLLDGRLAFLVDRKLGGGVFLAGRANRILGGSVFLLVFCRSERCGECSWLTLWGSVLG